LQQPTGQRRHSRLETSWPCTLTCVSKEFEGIVRNMSQDGLFVMTEAELAPGARVEVAVPGDRETPGMVIRAMVIQQQLVPGESRLVSHGLGLRVLEAPDCFYEISEGGPVTPPPEREASTQCFRVRLSQRDGSRFRRLTVVAESKADARGKIEADLGAKWRVVEVELEE